MKTFIHQRTLILGLGMLALYATGCQSLHFDQPIVAPEEADFDERLVGTWLVKPKEDQKNEVIFLHVGRMDAPDSAGFLDNFRQGNDFARGLSLPQGQHTGFAMVVQDAGGDLVPLRFVALIHRTDDGGWVSMPVASEFEGRTEVWYDLWRYKLSGDSAELWRVTDQSPFEKAINAGTIDGETVETGHQAYRLKNYDRDKLREFVESNEHQLISGEPLQFRRLDIETLRSAVK